MHYHREKVLLVSLTVIYYILYHRYLKTRKNLTRYKPSIYYPRFRWYLDLWDEETCIRYTRFSKAEFRTILPNLRLDLVRYKNRIRPVDELALAVLLTRLSYPHRMWEIQSIFGVSESTVSRIMNAVLIHLHKRYYKSTIEWHPMLCYKRIKAYARALIPWDGGGHIWGWIDGTSIRISRPRRRQRYYYSGYKKSHCLKYQGITTPDGLILSMSGPFPGEKNDVAMAYDTGLSARLEKIFDGHNQSLFLIGDKGYTQSRGIMPLFSKQPSLAPEQSAWNIKMSSTRIAVEQTFGQTKNLWSTCTWAKGLQVGQGPIGTYFPISVFFSNCWTCLHQRSAVAGRFPSIDIPSLEEYIRYPTYYED